MGIMMYTGIVLLFGMVIGSIFANAIRLGIARVNDIYRTFKGEVKVAMAEPVDVRVD
jgi:multisubunit Na+/H+ antiporter MnhG subunit